MSQPERFAVKEGVVESLSKLGGVECLMLLRFAFLKSDS